jgi:hypothetical protein
MKSNKNKIKYAFALVLLCLTALTAQTGLQHRFTAAGNFPGAYYTTPLGLSSYHIVGEYDSATVYTRTSRRQAHSQPPSRQVRWNLTSLA